MVSSPSIAPIVVSPATLEPGAVISVVWTFMLEQVWFALESGVEKYKGLSSSQRTPGSLLSPRHLKGVPKIYHMSFLQGNQIRETNYREK